MSTLINVSPIIDNIDNKKLNEHKDVIIQYFTENAMDNTKLFYDMTKNGFINALVGYSNDEQGKKAFIKLYESLQQLKNEPTNNKTDQKYDQPIDSNIQSSEPDTTKANDDPLAANLSYFDPSTIIDELNNVKLNEHKDNIIKYFAQNNLNQSSLFQLSRKEFAANLVEFCDDTKARGAFMKLFKNLTADQQHLYFDPTQIIKQIDNKKINEHKENIIKYFKENNMTKMKILTITRKDFGKNLTEFCNDFKAKGAFMKLHKNIEQFCGNDSVGNYIDPSAIINDLDNKKLNQHSENIRKYFKENKIDLVKFKSIVRKDFGKHLTEFCNDQKAKGAFMKLHKTLEKLLIDDDNNNNNDKKEEEEEKKIVIDIHDNKYDIDDEEEQEIDQETSIMNYEELMPTYINRAIWAESEETLERLIDKAVKSLLDLDGFWNKPSFIQDLYDPDEFEGVVDYIYELKYNFFNTFVSDTFKRELSIEAMKVEARLKNQKKSHNDQDINYPKRKKSDKHEIKEDYNYSVWFLEQKNVKDDNKHDDQDDDKDDGKDDGIKDQNSKFYQYHIYPKDIKANLKQPECVTPLNVKKTPVEYNWAVWKRRATTKKNAICKRAIQLTSQPTYGYWDILNNKKSIQANDKNGIKLDHLNIIFELLRHYFKEISIIRNKSNTKLMTIEKAKQFGRNIRGDLLLETYCTTEYDMWKESKCSIEIMIHHGLNDGLLYELTWWNCVKQTECNAFAIKCISAEPDKSREDINEKYYMRFAVNTLQHCMPSSSSSSTSYSNDKIEWYWYNNYNATYDEFVDYKHQSGYKYKHKKGLLHRQLEAIYLSNKDENYPWKLFDVQPKKGKTAHTFNHAQITHLKPALKENLKELIDTIGYKQIDTVGHLCRFTRSSWGNTNSILNIEQIAIKKQSVISSNILRNFNGQNSLLLQYSGAYLQINKWLRDHYLFTQDQKLYFWAFILCIAAKIKQIDIEVENQLVTIPKQEAFQTASDDAFSSSEIHQQQQDTFLYEGFLVPPLLGEQITDPTQFGNLYIAYCR